MWFMRDTLTSQFKLLIKGNIDEAILSLKMTSTVDKKTHGLEITHIRWVSLESKKLKHSSTKSWYSTSVLEWVTIYCFLLNTHLLIKSTCWFLSSSTLQVQSIPSHDYLINNLHHTSLADLFPWSCIQTQVGFLQFI